MDEQIKKIFFELHQDIPREGPGDAASTRNAFSMLAQLPPRPYILDIGCGPGKQTLDLARLTDGTIVAVDNHPPFVEHLRTQARLAGVADRVNAIVGDMFALDLEKERFDLIWSEGAIYIIGFEQGLRAWKPFLKSGGYMVVTQIAWFQSNPPEELRKFWEREYPEMQNRENDLTSISLAGYELIAHFPLPESAWWDDYYIPLEHRLPHLREKYHHDPEAIDVIEQHQIEIEMYRKYPQYYGYEFYLMRK